MQNISRNTWLQYAHDLFERMRALPEHHRKILAMSTMMAATMVLVAIVWLSFIPLQDLNLPAVDSQQAAHTEINTNTSNPSQVPPQFANVSSISEIGPISSFLDSFKAATNLLVPKELQYNPLGQTTTGSWQQKLSDILAAFPATIHNISGILSLFIQQMRALFISLSQLIITFLLELSQQIVAHASRTAN